MAFVWALADMAFVWALLALQLAKNTWALCGQLGLLVSGAHWVFWISWAGVIIFCRLEFLFACANLLLRWLAWCIDWWLGLVMVSLITVLRWAGWA